MNDCGSGRWMRTSELSLASFTVSGCQTDALRRITVPRANRQPVRVKSGYLESATCLRIIVPRSRGDSAHSERQSGSELRGAPTAW